MHGGEKFFHRDCHLPPASCHLPPASCLLPPAICLLPPAFCLLPSASCLLPPASCLLPSMISSQLTATLKRYEAAIETLKQSQSGLLAEEVLSILNGRDALQVALQEEKFLPTSQLKHIIELDSLLREQAAVIFQVITVEQLTEWRESIHPAPDAWWWRLETCLPPHPLDRFDPLWKLLTLASWAFNLSLLADLAKRFFSVGVGFIGAIAVTLPGLIALFQVSSELTKVGQENFDSLLVRFKVPPQWRQEAKLGLTLAVSMLILGIWLALPAFSNYFAASGFEDLQVGKLGSAEQDFKQAISLNNDNAQAHLYLGFIYEEYQEVNKAQKQYLIATGGYLPEAYNNLARLYIKSKKYSEAANLANRGLKYAKEKDVEERFNLLKNQGWARLQQKRYSEAAKLLQGAISIAEAPKTREEIVNPGSAHCLLAQTLEQQKQATALQQWGLCCQLGNRNNIDEDIWLHLAEEKLEEAGKSCSN
ncbi:MAG: tetratricopeptide repeat protein [Symploca sp. SIO3E6]|nr:tetratricopeptide repeat protein [Caldora sp. SIO3E6]